MKRYKNVTDRYGEIGSIVGEGDLFEVIRKHADEATVRWGWVYLTDNAIHERLRISVVAGDLKEVNNED